MSTETSGSSNGASHSEVIAAKKVVVVEGQEAETTPEHVKAYAELLNMVLTSPLATKTVETWGQVQIAKVNAQKDSAQQQATNADAAHKRQSDVAIAFLTRLAVLGGLGMAAMVAIAYSKILDGQAFGVLASTFITVLFGSGLYGTSLRNKSEK